MTSVNLIARDNGFGLSRDVHLLADVLREGGFEVHVSTLRRGKLRKWLRPARLRARLLWQRSHGDDSHGRFDVNLLLEHVRPEDLPFARWNLLIPNPEWCLPRDVGLLPRIDGVLVKTAHAEEIFCALGCRTARIGFTSTDRLDTTVPRERAFFHLAGRSGNKGTERALALWRKHPEWPRLTVVQNPRAAKASAPSGNIVHRVDYIDDAELRRMQNANLFHLCCSETEGFGHYIVEAMSVGAVVLTTNAPPMNELVMPERGVLVAYGRLGRQHLATTYQVDDGALERAVERALAMDDARIEAMGAQARAWFAYNDAGFAARLHQGLRVMLASQPSRE
ncbi:MAG: glycosyltransferase [Rhodanobacteraceae bacterium]